MSTERTEPDALGPGLTAIIASFVGLSIAVTGYTLVMFDVALGWVVAVVGLVVALAGLATYPVLRRRERRS